MTSREQILIMKDLLALKMLLGILLPMKSIIRLMSRCSKSTRSFLVSNKRCSRPEMKIESRAAILSKLSNLHSRKPSKAYKVTSTLTG
jgi:formylmethanofuran dehydrogenase subunit B